MPIQEEERASVKPAAKARPVLKPSINKQLELFSGEAEKMDRHWSEKIQGPLLLPDVKILYAITSTQHKEVGREEDAGVPYDRTVEKCKEILSEDSRYWSNEVKQKLNVAPHWSAEKWMDVLSKGGGQKKRFQYCLNPDYPAKLLYLRAIQGHSGKAYSGNARINPVLQDNVLLPKDFTKYVYHVGHGKELRSTVRIGWVPGGFSTKTGRCAVFFTVVDPMDDEQGLRETSCDLSKARNRALQEYLETTSRHGTLVQFIARSRRRTAILPNKVQCGRPLWHTACSVYWESGMHEN